jgi:hypothetical protein
VCIAVSNTYQFNGVIVGKLDGKVAVITGGSTGMALAGAKLFVDEGAHVSSRAGGRKRWTRPSG